MMVRKLARTEQPKDREDALVLAREDLFARLSAELRPERIRTLSRGELAKVVDAAVQAYLLRHRTDVDPLDRRNLITALLDSLNPAATLEPEAPEKLKERLEARISREQKALFKRAAELQGRTLTDFVIASAHEAAVRVIDEMEVIRLSAADTRAFADALLNPRQPPAKLKTAVQRYRKIVGQ